MNAASPATRLHDVTVIHEQSGVRWLAGKATIEAGRIVVTPAAAARPPSGFLDNPASTYTITALDGGGRARSFPGVTREREAAEAPPRYVFV